MLRFVSPLLLAPILTAAGAFALPQEERPAPVEESAPPPAEAPVAPEQEATPETPLDPAARAPAADSTLDPATIQAELRAIRARAARDFQAADMDKGGWISFREAESTMQFTREDFLAADTNADGRLSSEEFVERQMVVLQRVGAVVSPSLPHTRDPQTGEIVTLHYPPLPGAGSGPRPSDILRLFDRDANESLERFEIERVLRDLSIDLSADTLLAQLDPDESGSIELHELGPLIGLVGPRIPVELLRAADEDWRPHFLYTTAMSREQIEGSPPRPARILGPVTLFRRLDLSDDGVVDTDDLRRLTSPLRLTVRPVTILAALDLDGDGRLSSEEFDASLGR